MSNEEEENKNKTADAILEMLKEAGVNPRKIEDKKHAFWDTQVRIDWRHAVYYVHLVVSLIL